MADVSRPAAASTGAILQAGAREPYARSWVNVLNDWIKGLSGPAFLAYLVGAGLGVGLSYLPQQPTGREMTGLELGNVLYYGALPAAVLFLIDRLDRTAGQAFAVLRPLLAVDDSAATDMARRLTVVPARVALILTVIGIVLGPIGYVTDPVGSGIVGLSAGSLLLRFVWELFISAAFLILIYHTYRQLRLVDQLHARLGTIDLFDQGPLYGFSRVTSQTAIGLIVLVVPGIFLIPAGAGAGFLIISLAWYALAAAVAVAAFILPLRGIHDLVAAEKRRVQADLGRRISIALGGIQGAVDAGDDARTEAQNRALSTLVSARDVVNHVPTWPWSTGSLTGFVTALVLPIVLFLIQRYLGDALGA